MGLYTCGSSLSLLWVAVDRGVWVVQGPVWDGEAAGFWLRSRERSWDIALLGQPGDPKVLQFLSHPLTRGHPVLWVTKVQPWHSVCTVSKSLAEVNVQCEQSQGWFTLPGRISVGWHPANTCVGLALRVSPSPVPCPWSCLQQGEKHQ